MAEDLDDYRGIFDRGDSLRNAGFTQGLTRSSTTLIARSEKQLPRQ